MGLDLTSVNKSLNFLSDRVRNYLDNTPNIDGATYEQQQNVKYILDKYNEIVEAYGNLLALQRDVDYFIATCNKYIRLLSGNTELEKAQVNKLKSALSLMKDIAAPLNTEEKRLKVIEMFYRSICTRRDY